MNHLEILRAHLLEELKRTERTLASAKIARNNAPTPKESKSDTSRARLETEVTMHELRARELKNFMNAIPKNELGLNKIGLWSLIEVELPSGSMRITIVPDGVGGKKVKEIWFISDRTPIGLALLGKKSGDKFTFNGKEGRVVSVG